MAEVHDAQLDYYGQRLATGSSDCVVRVLEAAGEEQRLQAELRGHTGPVWKVAWAHPKFGNLLASASQDGTMCIWREAQPGSWQKVYSAPHEGSVNAVAWAPHSYGALLAAACADGSVSIVSLQNNQWVTESFVAHLSGANAVSWTSDGSAPRLATGGCDNHIRTWTNAEGKWGQQRGSAQTCHKNWVRDVQWAPSVGPASTIASCSNDKTVVIWSLPSHSPMSWAKLATLSFESAVVAVSWSETGNVLAVATDDGNCSIWKQAGGGQWQAMNSGE